MWVDGKNIVLIGISGKQGSGKDTFAGFLKTQLDYNNILYYKRVVPKTIHTAFAMRLKQLVKMLWGKSASTQDEKLSQVTITLNGKVETITVRDLLQKLGPAIRQVDEDAWIVGVLNLIREKVSLYGYTPFAIISDVRYENEKHACDINIRINRQEEQSWLTSDQQQHETEVILDTSEFDLIIDNSDLDSLKHKATIVADLLSFWMLTERNMKFTDRVARIQKEGTHLLSSVGEQQIGGTDS